MLLAQLCLQRRRILGTDREQHISHSSRVPDKRQLSHKTSMGQIIHSISILVGVLSLSFDSSVAHAIVGHILSEPASSFRDLQQIRLSEVAPKRKKKPETPTRPTSSLLQIARVPRVMDLIPANWARTPALMSSLLTLTIHHQGWLEDMLIFCSS